MEQLCPKDPAVPGEIVDFNSFITKIKKYLAKSGSEALEKPNAPKNSRPCADA